MKVKSELELEHFLSYITLHKNTITLVDKKREFYIAKVGDDTLNIHEDVIINIRIKNQHITIKSNIKH